MEAVAKCAAMREKVSDNKSQWPMMYGFINMMLITP